MSLAALTNTLRSTIHVGLKPVLARKTPRQLTSRTVFYTQRKRPATTDENMTLLVGFGALIASASVCVKMKIFDVAYGRAEQ
ncbi:hypothetical protein AC249_AIPGENE14559 [Exaiptasia diaphana]|nr:hypothetical protein AC249_AIPGENE14559 [Exaiptasia diaphana]